MVSEASPDKVYPVIEQAIKFIQNQRQRQPDLAELARFTGYSPDHLQRLFSQWAGISPKRFLQFLTAQCAREQLQWGRSVLDVSQSAGLSGPGRLHELIVTLESVTPGELATGGAGVRLTYGCAASPLGDVFAAVTERGICFMRFVTQTEATELQTLKATWFGADLHRDDVVIQQLVQQVFGDRAGDRSLSLLVKGTNFQLKVWEALLRTPSGLVTSYGDLARAAGSPGASRAVGSAMAANQIAVLIPCHRVIRENGVIGQYRWGSERKSALLLWEHVQRFGA